jgi:hypothetical protein
MNSDTSPAVAVSGYETVFTVTDYYDGPRRGLANYQGKPYFYECVFDEDNDDYSDQFRLTPIDEKTFKLAMEDWEIWRRWETAFHAGKADINSHPALPEERPRHEELRRHLDSVLVTDPHRAVIRIGKFDTLKLPNLPESASRVVKVKWS